MWYPKKPISFIQLQVQRWPGLGTDEDSHPQAVCGGSWMIEILAGKLFVVAQLEHEIFSPVKDQEERHTLQIATHKQVDVKISYIIYPKYKDWLNIQDRK